MEHEISNINFVPIKAQDPHRHAAFVSFVFDEKFYFNGIRLDFYYGTPSLSYPTYKQQNGEVAYFQPVDRYIRNFIEQRIFSEFKLSRYFNEKAEL